MSWHPAGEEGSGEGAWEAELGSVQSLGQPSGPSQGNCQCCLREVQPGPAAARLLLFLLPKASSLPGAGAEERKSLGSLCQEPASLASMELKLCSADQQPLCCLVVGFRHGGRAESTEASWVWSLYWVIAGARQLGRLGRWGREGGTHEASWSWPCPVHSAV